MPLPSNQLTPEQKIVRANFEKSLDYFVEEGMTSQAEVMEQILNAIYDGNFVMAALEMLDHHIKKSTVDAFRKAFDVRQIE